ncbi:sensor histidine kinase [Flavobacterium olei]|uniref:sensor histidine kinase n=1 Tax=Flavobacterium olei TaxID=1886782 RepID=UPI00321B6454
MKFTYNSRIIRHLGYELITSDAVALTELIKNSYDAKANKVLINYFTDIETINFNDFDRPIDTVIHNELKKINPSGILTIEDNGKGMDFNTLKKGFFEIGSTVKKDEKKNQQESDNTIILGDKGIGRLASQRISPILIVESYDDIEKEINVVVVEWSNFFSGDDYDAPEYKIKNQNIQSYTRLWLLGSGDQKLEFSKFFEIKDLFEGGDIFGNLGKKLGNYNSIKEDLNSALSFLYSPFEKENSVLNLIIKSNSQEVKIDFSQEVLKVAETKHSFDTEIILDENNNPSDLRFNLRMDIKPWFIERIHQNILGDVLFRSYKLDSKGYQSILDKYLEQYKKNLSDIFLLSDAFVRWNKKYNDELTSSFKSALIKIAPIQGQIYSFKRDQSLMSMARKSALDNGYIDDTTKINYSIRPFLESNNGIKLYRNSFRIGTIGNKDNDWLQLQQRRTSGQQFFRFELGNVVGYIKINDKKQEYIYETSSREHLTDNIYVDSLQKALTEILEIFSPTFNKRAVELTKHILDIEGLIPENSEKEVQREVDKSKILLEDAKRNIQLISGAFKTIKDKIDLDTDEKINTVRNVLKKLEVVTDNFEQNVDDTQKSLESANLLLAITREEQNRVKTEAYNNYKLMANGLVTEVITHELHSMLSNSEDEEKKYDQHIKTVQNYFLENGLYDLNKTHFKPVKDKFEHLYNRMGDLSKFYSFLEKTFITTEGNRILQPTELKSELEIINERFLFRTKRHNIDITFDDVSNVWEVPKGALLHVFYNLIDNSIYWIKQRQSLEKSIPTYKREEKDFIIIRTTSNKTIEFFDSGTGVVEKYQDILFNELVSGKENGRGMGLYIVRQFLKSFGGDIKLLDSKNEYGNRYIFEISINDYIEEHE